MVNGKHMASWKNMAQKNKLAFNFYLTVVLYKFVEFTKHMVKKFSHDFLIMALQHDYRVGLYMTISSLRSAFNKPGVCILCLKQYILKNMMFLLSNMAKIIEMSLIFFRYIFRFATRLFYLYLYLGKYTSDEMAPNFVRIVIILMCCSDQMLIM